MRKLVALLLFPAAIVVFLLLSTLSEPRLVAGQPAPRVTLSLNLKARALQPGEPVRLVAEISGVSDTPDGAGSSNDSARVIEVSANFAGETITFLPDLNFTASPATGLAERRERWIGWTLIPLDHEPGDVQLSVKAKGVDQILATAEVTLTILDKEFPEEHITVESKYVEPPKEVQQRLKQERSKLAAIYKLRTPLKVSTPFVRPVPGVPTSIFGVKRFFNGKPRSPHPGLDLRAATGTEVLASGNGDVVLAQDLYYSGNTVILDHGAGLFTLYAHLSRIDVGEGDSVTAGQTIALSGATGRVSGPHLHWGGKVGNKPFDPRALLAAELFQ